MTKQKSGLNLIGADGKVDERRVEIYHAVLDAVEKRTGQPVMFPINRLAESGEVLGRAMDAVQAQLSILDAAGVAVNRSVIDEVVIEAFARLDAADAVEAARDAAMPTGARRITGPGRVQV